MKFVLHTIPPMKVVRRQFLDAVTLGASAHGDKIVNVEGEYTEPLGDFDGVLIHGIAGEMGRRTFDDYLEAGKHVLFFDKGYSREDVLRVSVDSFQPVRYLMNIKRPDDRLRATGLIPAPYRHTARDAVVLFDGASEKYCKWRKLGSQLEWGQRVINEIKKYSLRPIIYRPRPSHNKAQYLEGAYTSQLILAVEFKRAAIVVSDGGNLCWDAVVAGVPLFELYESIAMPMAEKCWDHFETPRKPSVPDRLQWMANVMYCQWSLSELANGPAWGVIRQQLDLVRKP